MCEASSYDRHFVFLHGVLVDAYAQSPHWTFREKALWFFWRLRAQAAVFRPSDSILLWEATMAPIPALSEGAVLLAVDFSHLRLTYSRELPEAATVLNIDYLLRPAGGQPETWYPVRSWWRRFERIRLSGKSVSPWADDDNLYKQMPIPTAKLVRWEIQQVRPGWQQLNDAASRDLGNHWEQYRSTAPAAQARTTPRPTPKIFGQQGGKPCI